MPPRRGGRGAALQKGRTDSAKVARDCTGLLQRSIACQRRESPGASSRGILLRRILRQSTLFMSRGRTIFTLPELHAATELVHGVVPPTPQYAWARLSAATGCRVWVKH